MATTTRRAHTDWSGGLLDGSGEVAFDSSGIGAQPVSWAARSEEPGGKTSPEELIAAAHSSCLSMSLSGALARAGTPPTSLNTRAEVDFTPGSGITAIRLFVRGDVPGVDAAGFAAAANTAKENCPVSQALKSVPIELTVE